MGYGTVEGMIVQLRGTWQGAYVDVNGVGYDVEHCSALESGTMVDIVVRSVWRDGSGWTLFGFSSEIERELFDALCKVNRVGPNVAMSVLRTHGVAPVVSAIAAKDPKMLGKTPGVGPKTAELICGYAQLSDTLLAAKDDGGGGDDVVDALVALGYDERGAREAVRSARASGGDDEDVLRASLQIVRGAR